MSPSRVLEPTYDAIKRRLIGGAWPAGFRLEAARLAADLGVSITPVRDSLHHLAGERVVEMIPGEGFRVPRPSERTMRDLLDLNLLILLGAIDASDGLAPPGSVVPTNHAEATASLFLAIAARTGNGEMLASIEYLNARLHPFRLFEADVLPEASRDLDDLRRAFGSPDWTQLGRPLLARYHADRKRVVGQYVALI